MLNRLYESFMDLIQNKIGFLASNIPEIVLLFEAINYYRLDVFEV
jgi:hypothetical protein